MRDAPIRVVHLFLIVRVDGRIDGRRGIPVHDGELEPRIRALESRDLDLDGDPVAPDTGPDRRDFELAIVRRLGGYGFLMGQTSDEQALTPVAEEAVDGER